MRNTAISKLGEGKQKIKRKRVGNHKITCGHHRPQAQTAVACGRKSMEARVQENCPCESSVSYTYALKYKMKKEEKTSIWINL